VNQAAVAPLATAWMEWEPGRRLPDVARGLEGWQIEKRRPSHWNARRCEGQAQYFLKWFFHPPWRCPARREFMNARRLAELGVPSVTACGWGRHPRGSFVALEAASGVAGDAWLRSAPARDELHRLARGLAELAARLHDAGICHKDLNVYHVFVHSGSLRIIDVGRVARFWRRRWIVKDLASLLYTAEREGFPHSCQRDFLRCYCRASKRSWSRASLLRAVARKAAVYRAHNEKAK